MNKIRIGLAMTGSFCTFDTTFRAVEALGDAYEFTPLMSERAYATDTRFGSAREQRERLQKLCGGREILHSIVDAEPVGPKDYFDLLLIAPCTGNTLARLAYGITDGCVSMAAKSHLRGGKPVLLALSTNDALSGSARSLGMLLGRKHVYFLPFRQDDPVAKPYSMVSDYSHLNLCIQLALQGKQLQPLLA